ncbi:acyltransferase family protein [Demequina sp.]|uniref:acyltransferase family protein n=1 Tax=Demequina sp. TaxID=2050685 RepID=UPI0025E14D3D|nr:acyltransferase family protein [Demequina sp.]
MATGTDAGRTRERLRPDIQALRALAVLGVVVFHAWPQRLTGGFVGVDVFFVISGFLIVGHLAREVDLRGGIDLRGFWARRVRRLLPSSMLVILAIVAMTLLWVPEARWRQFLSEAVASTLYVENWVLARSSTDYLSATQPPSPTQHFWSLSVEEQFYLVVPVLLAVVVALAQRRWRIALVATLALATAASYGFSIAYTGANPQAAYFVTTTRAWEFAAGGLVALLGLAAPARLRAAFAWVGVAAIAGSMALISGEMAFPGAIAAVPVVGTALVIVAAHDRGVFGAVASWRPVQGLGRISYAFYLWHWPLLAIPVLATGNALDYRAKLGLIALTALLAWLTTQYLEDPIRFRLVRVPAYRRAVGVGIVASMAAVVLVGVAVPAQVEREAQAAAEAAIAAASAAAESSPDPSGGGGDASTPEPGCFGAPAALDQTCAAPDTVVPAPALAVKDTPDFEECFGHDGSSELEWCTFGDPDAAIRIAAIGDSHLYALTPALERLAGDLGWRIDVMAHTGCYWSDAPRRRPTVALEQECADWNANIESHLDSMDRPYDAAFTTLWESLRVHAEPPISEMQVKVEGLVSTWTRSIARGTPVIAVTDVPLFPEDTPDCVARNGAEAAVECAEPADVAIPARESVVIAASRMDAGVTVIDLARDIYCPGAACAPVVGGVAMFTDGSHLTATYVRTLTPYLGTRLEEAYARVDAAR